MTQPTTTPASGRDLARQALAQARAAAKTAPAVRKKTARHSRTDRGTGRDPVGVGSLLAQLNVQEEWNLALDGGSIHDRWAGLCPQFVGLAQPEGFDAEQGILRLRPGSHVYATQLRMYERQVIKQINTKLGRTAVRRIVVLPVGPIATAPPPELTPEPRPEPGPVRTRETASAGYRRTLQAALDNKPARDPHATALVQAAIDRQNRALTNPDRREPKDAFSDAVAERQRLTSSQTRSRADAIRQAALHQKHTGGKTIQTAFQQTA
ncbi:DciA family protein [Streptomyces sp. Wb2n-11]|uniref:DciA family protein n=1 Tax=Streptomyces sp. Wb2n-11 TaxID=1030533 RepID=UPI000AF9F926|nr:DUF721 domain-containing protein [Streptomyces sp. Wb2n-11]